MAALVGRRPYLMVVPVCLLPIAVLAIRLDLLGPRRSPQWIAENRAIRARDEVRIAREAAHMPVAGRVPLTFRNLSFVLPPEALGPGGRSQGYAAYVPMPLRHYDGREIRITGYMLPTQMENGRVRSCLILANQMACCYGGVPRACDFIVARMTGALPESRMDQPIAFEGRLHIGDVFVDGFWTALYSLDCTAVNP